MQVQLDMVLDMQVNEGHSLRRQLDRIREELCASVASLRAFLQECALADGAEERNAQIVCEFNDEAMWSRASVA